MMLLDSVPCSSKASCPNWEPGRCLVGRASSQGPDSKRSGARARVMPEDSRAQRQEALLRITFQGGAV